MMSSSDEKKGSASDEGEQQPSHFGDAFILLASFVAHMRCRLPNFSKLKNSDPRYLYPFPTALGFYTIVVNDESDETNHITENIHGRSISYQSSRFLLWLYDASKNGDLGTEIDEALGALITLESIRFLGVFEPLISPIHTADVVWRLIAKNFSTLVEELFLDQKVRFYEKLDQLGITEQIIERIRATIPFREPLLSNHNLHLVMPKPETCIFASIREILEMLYDPNVSLAAAFMKTPKKYSDILPVNVTDVSQYFARMIKDNNVSPIKVFQKFLDTNGLCNSIATVPNHATEPMSLIPVTRLNGKIPNETDYAIFYATHQRQTVGCLSLNKDFPSDILSYKSQNSNHLTDIFHRSLGFVSEQTSVLIKEKFKKELPNRALYLPVHLAQLTSTGINSCIWISNREIAELISDSYYVLDLPKSASASKTEIYSFSSHYGQTTFAHYVDSCVPSRVIGKKYPLDTRNILFTGTNISESQVFFIGLLACYIHDNFEGFERVYKTIETDRGDMKLELPRILLRNLYKTCPTHDLFSKHPTEVSFCFSDKEQLGYLIQEVAINFEIMSNAVYETFLRYFGMHFIYDSNMFELLAYNPEALLQMKNLKWFCLVISRFLPTPVDSMTALSEDNKECVRLFDKIPQNPKPDDFREYIAFVRERIFTDKWTRNTAMLAKLIFEHVKTIDETNFFTKKTLYLLSRIEPSSYPMLAYSLGFFRKKREDSELAYQFAEKLANLATQLKIDVSPMLKPFPAMCQILSKVRDLTN